MLHCTRVSGRGSGWHAFCMGLWAMTFIIAVIKPFRLDKVRDALIALGVSGMTVTEAKGFGRQKGHTETYRGAEYEISLVPKLRIEVAVEDALAARAVEAIQEAAHTGAIGDGKIFWFDLAGAVRIRTGETNETAL